jgi:hypothetical protein
MDQPVSVAIISTNCTLGPFKLQKRFVPAILVWILVQSECDLAWSWSVMSSHFIMVISKAKKTAGFCLMLSIDNRGVEN